MKATLHFLWVTTVHKFYVFKYGLRTRAPLWRLFVHDYTKYLPSEAPYYGQAFYGDKGNPEGFNRAWLHHQNYNPHHWQHWLQVEVHKDGKIDVIPLPMPEWAIREMVADWMAASHVYSGFVPSCLQNWVWWQTNQHRILLHGETIVKLYQVFEEVFGAGKDS